MKHPHQTSKRQKKPVGGNIQLLPYDDPLLWSFCVHPNHRMSVSEARERRCLSRLKSYVADGLLVLDGDAYRVADNVVIKKLSFVDGDRFVAM